MNDRSNMNEESGPPRTRFGATLRKVSSNLSSAPRLSGSQKFANETIQFAGWLKKNRGGKSFEAGSVRRWFHQVGFQLRAFETEMLTGECSIVDLRNALFLRPSRDPMVTSASVGAALEP